MPFQSRAAWTTRPNRAVATKRRQRHLTWHYPGFGTDSVKTATWAHSRCLSQIDTWEKQHQARGSKNIEYNLFACSHGYLIEGRGNRQNGANGTSAANRAGMSCQVLIGDNEPLTSGHRSAMREAVVWAEGKHPGMTSTQYGHRHWVGTRCPGPYVMAEIPVRAGVSVPAPGASVPAQSKADPSKPWTTSPRVAGMSVADVKAIQTELVDAGYDLGKHGVDGVYGDSTGTAVQQFQTDLGLTADGVWGPATQEALMTLKSDVAAIKARTDRYLDHKTSDVVVKLLAQLPKLVWGVGGGANAPMIGRRLEGGKEYPETTLGSLTDRIVRQQLVPLRGEVAGLSKAIEQLAAGKGVDPEEIKAAVAAGVDEALGSLDVTVSKQS